MASRAPPPYEAVSRSAPGAAALPLHTEVQFDMTNAVLRERRVEGRIVMMKVPAAPVEFTFEATATVHQFKYGEMLRFPDGVAEALAERIRAAHAPEVPKGFELKSLGHKDLLALRVTSTTRYFVWSSITGQAVPSTREAVLRPRARVKVALRDGGISWLRGRNTATSRLFATEIIAV